MGYERILNKDKTKGENNRDKTMCQIMKQKNNDDAKYNNNKKQYLGDQHG